jgi:hypothetical protein
VPASSLSQSSEWVESDSLGKSFFHGYTFGRWASRACTDRQQRLLLRLRPQSKRPPLENVTRPPAQLPDLVRRPPRRRLIEACRLPSESGSRRDGFVSKGLVWMIYEACVRARPHDPHPVDRRLADAGIADAGIADAGMCWPGKTARSSRHADVQAPLTQTTAALDESQCPARYLMSALMASASTARRWAPRTSWVRRSRCLAIPISRVRRATACPNISSIKDDSPAHRTYPQQFQMRRRRPRAAARWYTLLPPPPRSVASPTSTVQPGDSSDQTRILRAPTGPAASNGRCAPESRARAREARVSSREAGKRWLGSSLWAARVWTEVRAAHRQCARPRARGETRAGGPRRDSGGRPEAETQAGGVGSR